MALQSPEYLHNIQYEAIKDRYAIFAGLQEGVYAAGDLAVTQRAAGANMTVDIAAGRALVQGDTQARQGIYHLVNDAAITGTTIAANASGNPRIDQVGLLINDSTDVGSGSDIPAVTVLAGTPAGGATLDNRTGAAALPANMIRLADILVANGAASITNTVIRDRRPWMRGAYVNQTQASGASGTDYTTTSTSYVELDGTNTTARVECSGCPLRVTLRAQAFHTATGGWIAVQPRIDGASVNTIEGSLMVAPGINLDQLPFYQWEIPAPVVGSHKVGMWWRTSAGTASLERPAGGAGTDFPIQFTVEEIVRQNAANNTSAGTSG